jgi:hypothetical protein
MITEKKLEAALAKIDRWRAKHPHGKAMSGLSVPGEYYFGGKADRKTKTVHYKIRSGAAATWVDSRLKPQCSMTRELKKLAATMAEIKRLYPAGSPRYSAIVENPFEAGYWPLKQPTKADKAAIRRFQKRQRINTCRD